MVFSKEALRHMGDKISGGGANNLMPDPGNSWIYSAEWVVQFFIGKFVIKGALDIDGIDSLW